MGGVDEGAPTKAPSVASRSATVNDFKRRVRRRECCCGESTFGPRSRDLNGRVFQAHKSLMVLEWK